MDSDGRCNISLKFTFAFTFFFFPESRILGEIADRQVNKEDGGSKK